MSGTLVLALPGALCAVMAWDLSRPTSTPPRIQERAAAGALTVCAGTCLAAALWDTAATQGAGVLGAVCLVALLALVTRGRRRGRRRRPSAVPAQRTHLHVAVPAPTAPAPTPDRTKEPA